MRAPLPLGFAPVCAHAAVWAWNASDLSRDWDTQLGAELTAAFVLRGGLLALVALALGAHFARRVAVARAPSTASDRSGPALSGVLICALVALLVATFFASPQEAGASYWDARSLFFTSLVASQLVALTTAWMGAARGSAARVVAFNVALSLVLLESLAVAWATLSPSPLLFNRSAVEHLAAKRRPAGELHFGHRLNSSGYLDDEFEPNRPGELGVAVIADSFGLGIVPRPENFVDVAEAALSERLGDRFERISLFNFGVPAIGLSEYAVIYDDEVRALRPQLVVLALFIGNDITEDRPLGVAQAKRYRLQAWHLWSVGARLAALARATRPELARAAAIGTEQTPGAASPDPAARQPHAALPPTFDEATFLNIELRRLDVTRAGSKRTASRMQRFLSGLEYFRVRSHGRLALLVIPDEFQVNDSLWQQLMQRVERPAEHQRDWPQAQIMRFCELHNVPCLDLLPLLREAERSAPTYHPRDTHFNARGNAIAGDGLATLVEQATR